MNNLPQIPQFTMQAAYPPNYCHTVQTINLPGYTTPGNPQQQITISAPALVTAVANNPQVTTAGLPGTATIKYESQDQRTVRLEKDAERKRQKRAQEVVLIPESLSIQLPQHPVDIGHIDPQSLTHGRIKTEILPTPQVVYTPEKQKQLEANAERMRTLRANEGLSQREMRLRREAERARLRRANESPETRRNRLAIGRERSRLLRANQSPESRSKRLAIGRERSRQRRANESPESRRNRLSREAERVRMKRAAESLAKQQRQAPFQQQQQQQQQQQPQQQQQQPQVVAQLQPQQGQPGQAIALQVVTQPQ